jgi:hypothetical protein
MNLHAEYFNILVSSVYLLLHKLEFGLQAGIFISEHIELDFDRSRLVL